MRILSLLMTFSVFAACGQSLQPASVKAPVPAARPAPVTEPSPRVPPFQRPNWRARRDPSLPAIEKVAQVKAAVSLILEFEGDPRLRTSEDAAAMRLLHSYQDGSRPFKVAILDTKNIQGLPGRTAYSCQGDLYALMPDLRSSIPTFALALYHEVQHAVACDAALAQLGIPRDQADARLSFDPCDVEPAAYSGSIRLLTAMIDRGRPPTDFSPQDDGDIGSLEAIYQAWAAMSENRFCNWYRGLKAEPPAVP